MNIDVECERWGEDLLWLSNSSQPWDLVEEKWAKTAQVRLSKLRQSNQTLEEYINSYPALKTPRGIYLFKLDCEALYSKSRRALQETFPKFRNTIIEYGKKRLKEVKGFDAKSALQDVLQALDLESKKTNSKYHSF